MRLHGLTEGQVGGRLQVGGPLMKSAGEDAHSSTTALQPLDSNPYSKVTILIQGGGSFYLQI